VGVSRKGVFKYETLSHPGLSHQAHGKEVVRFGTKAAHEAELIGQFLVDKKGAENS
jgi:hypothetical protein